MDMKIKVDHFIHELLKKQPSSGGLADGGSPSYAHLEDYRNAEAPEQFGHHKCSDHQSGGAGVVTALVPAPIKGTTQTLEFTLVPFYLSGSRDTTM